MFEHVDLTGLETIRMKDAPLISSAGDVNDLLKSTGNEPLVAAGMRHSQGGQTAVENGHMLVMETMRKVGPVYPDSSAPGGYSIEVEAGATWSDIHRVVCTHGLAPIVQQSSAHFTIGGSLSVDCHGRDIRYGTMADTVNWVEVLLPGETIPTKAFPESALFRAVVGGYGACGLILRASLKLDKNWVMGREVLKAADLSEYAGQLWRLEKGSFALKDVVRNTGETVETIKRPVHMHFAWANVFEKNNYLKQFLPHYGFVDRFSPAGASHEHGLGRGIPPSALKSEGWGTSEIMRAAWDAAKIKPKFGADLWGKLKESSKKASYDQSRLDYLREDIVFTSSMTDGRSADLLQEYFIPVGRFQSFMESLAKEIPLGFSDVKILSCTIRYLQASKVKLPPFMSYMPREKSMVSVAIEVNVKVRPEAHGEEKEKDEGKVPIHYVPVKSACDKLRKAIEAAIGAENDGSFYLPYRLFASHNQIRRAYPGFDDFLKNVNTYNWRFDSEFLKKLRGVSPIADCNDPDQA